MTVHQRFKSRTLSGAQELRLQMGHCLTGGNIVYGTGVLRGIRWDLFSLFPGMLFPFIQKLYLNPVPGLSTSPKNFSDASQMFSQAFLPKVFRRLLDEPCDLS